MKKKGKNIISTILSLVLGIGIIGGSVALINKVSKEEYKTVTLSYKTGNVNDKGAYIENDNAIYSELFECKGLIIKPNFDSKVDYCVYFYDVGGSFDSKTEFMHEEYTPALDTIITHARIVIKFNSSYNNEDDKIGILEKLDIQNDIKVQVYKNQSFSKKDLEKSGNKFECDSSSGVYQLSKPINCNLYDYVLIKVKREHIKDYYYEGVSGGPKNYFVIAVKSINQDGTEGEFLADNEKDFNFINLEDSNYVYAVARITGSSSIKVCYNKEKAAENYKNYYGTGGSEDRYAEVFLI